MKAYTIEIYDDDLNARLEQIKNETGRTYANMMRTGLKMLLREMETAERESGGRENAAAFSGR